MERELILDNYLDTIYLQEDIKGLIRKLKNPSSRRKIEAALKSKNMKKMVDAFKFVPAIPPKQVVAMARRKLRGFDTKYKDLSRKYNMYDRPEEEIQLLAVAETAKENLESVINTVDDINIEVPDMSKSDLSVQNFLSDKGSDSLKQGGILFGVWSMLSILAWVFAGILGAFFAFAASATGVGAVFLLVIAIIFIAISSIIWFVKQLKQSGLDDIDYKEDTIGFS